MYINIEDYYICRRIQKYNEIKEKKYHTVETVLKSNRKIVERDKIDAPNTHTHDCSLSWLGTGTSVKSGGVQASFYA